MDGTVKVWKSDKGYGFVAADDGPDVFLHITALDGQGEPNIGQRVSFDVLDTEKGKRALNARLMPMSRSIVHHITDDGVPSSST